MCVASSLCRELPVRIRIFVEWKPLSFVQKIPKANENATENQHLPDLATIWVDPFPKGYRKDPSPQTPPPKLWVFAGAALVVPELQELREVCPETRDP